MKELIIQSLAQLFDKFKARNPLIALIIISLIGGFNLFIESGGTDYLGDSIAKYLQYFSWVWLALQGSRTSRYTGQNLPPTA